MRGKRAIDLGSGMGLAGLALALVGADVVLTDTAEVLPLLRRNSEANLSPAALRGAQRLVVVVVVLVLFCLRARVCVCDSCWGSARPPFVCPQSFIAGLPTLHDFKHNTSPL